MGVHVVKRVLAALGVASVLVLGGGVPASADGEDDARTVFCLGKGRADLRGAADSLGVPAPTEIAKWPTTAPADFARVCAALYGAEKAPSPGWFSQALPFLTGLFGALLAYVATAWRDRITRGRKQGEDLRAVLTEFTTAGSAYLSPANFGGRSDAAVVAARAKLVSQLALVRSEHRGWRRVATLLDELRDGSLGEPLTARTGQGDAARSRDAQLREKLDELRDEVLLVATALARPARQHPEMSPRSR